MLPLPAPPRPSFCLTLRGFSLVELGIDRGSEDAAFIALAAPFSLWALPVSELFHLAGHRARATTTPAILCVSPVLCPGRVAPPPCPWRPPSSPPSPPPQKPDLPPLDRLHRQLKLFFSGKRDIPHSVMFDLSRQCRGGSATALSRCPAPPRTFSPHHPSWPPVALFLLVSNERLVGSTLMQLSTIMPSLVRDRVATYSFRRRALLAL